MESLREAISVYTLYSVYTTDLPPPIQAEFIAYADDITQIVKYEGKSKELMARKTKLATEILITKETGKYKQINKNFKSYILQN